MNTIQLAGTNGNDAAKDNNTRWAQITGRDCSACFRIF
jgi:hypothetical protein